MNFEYELSKGMSRDIFDSSMELLREKGYDKPEAMRLYLTMISSHLTALLYEMGVNLEVYQEMQRECFKDMDESEDVPSLH